MEYSGGDQEHPRNPDPAEPGFVDDQCSVKGDAIDCELLLARAAIEASQDFQRDDIAERRSRELRRSPRLLAPPVGNDKIAKAQRESLLSRPEGNDRLVC